MQQIKLSCQGNENLPYAIDNATTIDAVNTAKNNAINAVNAIKTTAEKLTDAKSSAKEELDTLLAGKNENDYDADDWTALNQAITNGKDAIDNATTIDAVNTAKNNAISAVNTIKTTAEKLADAKTSAKEELDTLLAGKNENDYDADDWTALNQAITNGKNAIDNATTIDAVDTAKNNAISAVNVIKTKAEKAAEALAAAKETATAEVNDVNALDYIITDQQTVTDAKTTALEAIAAATTVSEVNDAMTAFNTAIANCTTQDAADQAAVDRVTALINALPAMENIKPTDKPAIEAARAAYDDLTGNQKARISADELKKLKDAEDMIVILQVMSEVSAKTGNDVTYTGNPIQLINTPTTALPEGYTMKYVVTKDKIVPAGSAYITSVPTATDAGIYYVWYKVISDSNNIDIGPLYILVTITTYYYDSGVGSIWTQSSGLPLYFHIKNTGDDSQTFIKFTGIKIDGKRVTRENFEKEKGSVIIKLKANYLETLKLGEHKLTAEFEDGSADTKFTVVERLVDPDGLPQTGDNSHLLIYALAGVIALTGLVLMKRKRR